MSVLAFEPSYLPEPRGLVNVGQRCWANTGLQVMPTITSLTEGLEAAVSLLNDPKLKVAKLYMQYLIMTVPRLQKKFPALYGALSAHTLETYVSQIIAAVNETGLFPPGEQNCAHQFIVTLIDMICAVDADGTGPLAHLRPNFDMTYSRTVTCGACGHNRVTLVTEAFVTVPRGERFDKYLRKQDPETIQDVFCDPEYGGCGIKATVVSVMSIKRLSSVIGVYTMPRQLREAGVAPLRPDELKFVCPDGSVVTYALVASVEHTPGHYFAIVQRGDRDTGTPSWHRIDDASITPAQPIPATTTNFSIYHLV